MHRLLEEAGRGAFAGSSPTIAERWEQLVGEAEQAMGANALERRFAPLKDSAPKYEVTRNRAQMRAAELAEQTASDEPRAADANATSPYGYELRVESDDGLIAGRIDRAIAAGDGTSLQDYKSGAIFSLQEGEAPQLKPEYVLQLHLYAALYREATGTWPVRLELIPLTGAPKNVPFSHHDCRALLDRAKSLLTTVNEKLRQSGGRDAIEASLATPSATACRYCPFRPACAAYLSAEHTDDERAWPADAWGSFTSLTKLGNGRYMIRAVRSDGIQLFIRDVDEEVIADSLASVEEGMLIGAFNLRRSRLPYVYETSQLTTVYCRDAPGSRSADHGSA